MSSALQHPLEGLLSIGTKSATTGSSFDGGVGGREWAAQSSSHTGAKSAVMTSFVRGAKREMVLLLLLSFSVPWYPRQLYAVLDPIIVCF